MPPVLALHTYTSVQLSCPALCGSPFLLLFSIAISDPTRYSQQNQSIFLAPRSLQDKQLLYRSPALGCKSDRGSMPHRKRQDHLIFFFGMWECIAVYKYLCWDKGKKKSGIAGCSNLLDKDKAKSRGWNVMLQRRCFIFCKPQGNIRTKLEDCLKKGLNPPKETLKRPSSLKGMIA